MGEIQFTDEQQLALQYAVDGYDVLVDACIGSGKTTVIQEACKRLYAIEKSVLYLTFNRRLLEEARKRIDPQHADVHTYHSYAGKVLNSCNIPSSSEREVPFLFTKRVKRAYKYDVIVVDEYQDVSEDLKDMLWHICRMSYNNYGFCPQFLVVGDRDQKIMDNTAIDAVACMEELFSFLSKIHGKEYRQIQFTNCFRLSAGYAAKIGQAWGRSIIGRNPDCKVGKKNLVQTALFLSQFEPKDILVLGNNMSWGARAELQNMLESRFPEKFNKDTVYSSITERDGSRRNIDTSECAVFTTYDSAKGMERKVCIMCNFDDGYLKSRLEHQTSRKVIKNLFLVAASRGKEYNIVCEHGKGHILNFSAIAEVSGKTKIDMRAEYISEMFDFKRKEDVDRCLEHIRTKEIQNPACDTIDIELTSGHINLAPCIGIHTQAAYFDNYDVDMSVLNARLEREARGIVSKLPAYKESWPLWKKILYLTAMTTGQDRYFKQITKSYLDKKSEDRVIERLSKHLPKDCDVEVPCAVVYRGCRDAANGMEIGEKLVKGRMDAIADGIPWELKFADSIKAEHLLQAAMYAIANCSDHAILWNLKTNEVQWVEVDDAQAFLEDALTCISKGQLYCAEAAMMNAETQDVERIGLFGNFEDHEEEGE